MLNGVGPVKSTMYNKGYGPLESGEGVCSAVDVRVVMAAGPQDKGFRHTFLKQGFRHTFPVFMPIMKIT